MPACVLSPPPPLMILQPPPLLLQPPTVPALLFRPLRLPRRLLPSPPPPALPVQSVATLATNKLEIVFNMIDSGKNRHLSMDSFWGELEKQSRADAAKLSSDARTKHLRALDALLSLREFEGAMQTSSAAPEGTFSIMNFIYTEKRRRLDPDTLERLVLIQIFCVSCLWTSSNPS